MRWYWILSIIIAVIILLCVVYVQGYIVGGLTAAIQQPCEPTPEPLTTNTNP
jgi:hypothetical protein